MSEPHIHSSNPDIEASVRANSTEGYVFIINHEAAQPQATVRLADLGFRIKRMVDVESGEPVPFRSTRDGIEFPITAAFGSTRLLRILHPEGSSSEQGRLPTRPPNHIDHI